MVVARECVRQRLVVFMAVQQRTGRPPKKLHSVCSSMVRISPETSRYSIRICFPPVSVT